MRVDCDHIDKRFEARNGPILALADLSFSTQEQEFLCILGPSGCGKTTLLRIIAGVLEPSSGSVSFRGSRQQKGPGTALVFQEYGVFPWMNVIDNVCFGLEMRGVDKKARYRTATPLIERIGLGGFVKSYPHQLSSGMKQRVGLARALVSGADILLMDEPFAALDAQMRLILQELLLDIKKEYRKSVIFVTHDVEEAITLADRIILLTRRPGQVRDEIELPFAQPREINGANAAKLLDMRTRIWGQIREEVERSVESTSL
jgi:ABC-type nitrate/sulfonate/bicarbonate transport system ATPase subunit